MKQHTGTPMPHPAALGTSERDALEPIYARMRHVVPEVEWAVHAPYVAAINALKRERNAVILAHNYQTPEIFHGIADYTGDSLGLAQQAAVTEAAVIVQCGVHFMAETSKVLSPHKTVLIPDTEAGCSLADAITPADIALLRQRYPGVPVVTYVNTSAAVKAASDICCTSANALEIVESLGTDRVIFLPDQYLGRWVASRPRSRSSSGRAPARSMSGSPGRSCANTASVMPGSTSSRTRNARRTCSRKPTTWARPRAWCATSRSPAPRASSWSPSAP